MESDTEAGKTPFQKSQTHSPHHRPMSILQPIDLADNICENDCNITYVVVIHLQCNFFYSYSGAYRKSNSRSRLNIKGTAFNCN